MSEDIPSELLYTASHEWVRIESDDIVVVGITDFAQNHLGELVFVDSPDLDASLDQGDEIAVVESVKAAADIYAPLSGTVVAVNEDLEDAPGLVNSDPYGDGWLFKLHLKAKEELNELMNADDYQAHLAEEEV